MDNTKEQIREEVKNILDDYLTAHKYRKTTERYAILDLIYSESSHFNIDTLHEKLTQRNFRISRATLYHTMQLLLECNLVLKHQFGKNLSFYERAYNNDFHFHSICTICNKVSEHTNSKLKAQIQNTQIKQFVPSNYNLYIFGVCNICARNLKKQQKLAKLKLKQSS